MIPKVYVSPLFGKIDPVRVCVGNKEYYLPHKDAERIWMGSSNEKRYNEFVKWRLRNGSH